MVNSNLFPPHVLFSTFFSLSPQTATTLSSLVNWMIALALQTIPFLLFSTGALNFIFAVVSHFALNKFDICKNQLLLIKLLITKLELFLSRTSLIGF